LAHQPRLLFVEDDADIRETLADLLRDEGYDVHEAASAQEGLQQLAGAHFDVLLSDYRLPDQNGTAMIAQAAQAGALAGTAVLLLSASTQIEGAEGLRVLQKPIELDALVREIEATAPLPRPAARAAEEGRVKLVLFVVKPSANAEHAERTLHALLRRHGIDAGCLEVVDVGTAQGSARAAEERVAFTPTLLRLAPLPRRWIVGDLRRKAVVERLLRESGAGG
jgi:CheY-like chemotaxis protein